jgi:hypothetical protein
MVLWNMAGYPPGTELPKLPPADLSPFPRWLRPFAAWHMSRAHARLQRRLEARRAEFWSRAR